MALKNVGGQDLSEVFNPIFTVKDGNIIIGFHIYAPMGDRDFKFLVKHFKFPKKVQERLVAIDNHIKLQLNLKSSLDDIFNPDISILKLIHGGFRYSISAEIISNIKSAIIE